MRINDSIIIAERLLQSGVPYTTYLYADTNSPVSFYSLDFAAPPTNFVEPDVNQIVEVLPYLPVVSTVIALSISYVPKWAL
jgi:hypothetical protein